MKRNVLLLILSFSLLVCISTSWVQPQAITSNNIISWEFIVTTPSPSQTYFRNWTYGTLANDVCFSMVECTGGGFALAGYTNVTDNFTDFWLVRADQDGNHLWNKTYGGYALDWCYSVIECNDGGFVLAGETYSFGAGSEDIWLVRTDADGNQLWNKTLGGPSIDYARSIVECSGGGFVITGTTLSYGAGGNDVWLVRTDADGNHLWNETYGGIYHDDGYSVIECSVGGFAIAGTTSSFGAGNWDVWIIRTDASGNHVWNETFGDTGYEYGYDLLECAAGGFAAIGYTNSFGAGNNDAWLIRTDGSGNHQWNQTYGGANHEAGRALVECSAGGFAVTGINGMYGGYSNDAWLMRINASGYQLWNQTFSGIGNDVSYSVVESAAGGFAIAGYTDSFGAGGEDMWLTLSQRLRWQENPTNQFVEFGSGGFHYDLNATAILAIDEWWLNDTTHFAITTQGVITNTTVLGPAGTFYRLNVRVNDTENESLTAHFTLTIQDTTAPTWITTPTDQTLAYGEPLALPIQATDLSGVASRTVNDTTNFEINTTHYLVNAGVLNPGVYGLNITVEDSFGNALSSTITVTVQASIPPIPGFPVGAIAVGFASALGVGLISRRRRRKPR